MGVEDMQTGEITPMDICYNCLWKPIDEKWNMNYQNYKEYIDSPIGRENMKKLAEKLEEKCKEDWDKIEIDQKFTFNEV